MKQDEIKIGSACVLVADPAGRNFGIPRRVFGQAGTVLKMNFSDDMAVVKIAGETWGAPLDMLQPAPEPCMPKPAIPEPKSPPCYSCGGTEAHTERCGPTHEAQGWKAGSSLPYRIAEVKMRRAPRPPLVACPCGRPRVGMLSVPGEEGISEMLWTCLYCAGAK